MAAGPTTTTDEAGDSSPQAPTSRFTDIPDDAWYRHYVQHLADLGITVGRADGTYGPHQPMTRAQAAAFISRAVGDPPEATTSRFRDIPDDARYLRYVEHLADLGITVGRADGTYGPHQPMTRAQAAAFISRAVGDPPEATTSRFRDIPDDAW